MSIIDNPRLKQLWQTAQTEDEWATTRLWEYIFKTLVFKGPEWAISSQQPPTHNDLRRVDIVIENSGKSGVWVPFLFVEAKLARATVANLVEVEHQALTASIDYTNKNRVKRVCSMTCFGGRAKLWFYEDGQDYLTPFVPPNTVGLAVKDEYIEVNSADGKLILEGLKYIRDNRVPPESILPSTSSPPRPSRSQGGASSSSSRRENLVPAGQRAVLSPETIYFVETWLEGQGVYFRTERDRFNTRIEEWCLGKVAYEGSLTDCSYYPFQGTNYYTWALGTLAQDPVSTKGKGRQTRH